MGPWPSLTVSEDLDKTVAVMLAPRASTTVWKILKELYLDQSRRASYLTAQGLGHLPYRGSQEWSRFRDRDDAGRKGALSLVVDVGCHCEHDCCGHTCGLEYRIELTELFYVITSIRHYNR